MVGLGGGIATGAEHCGEKSGVARNLTSTVGLLIIVDGGLHGPLSYQDQG